MKKEFQIDRYIIVLFLCLFLMFVSAVYNIEQYYYDAGYYWTIADPVFEGADFHLLRFPETFRGCLFPILVGG